jgi:hypothetical protein
MEIHGDPSRSVVRLRLRMSAAQAQASAPENLPSPAPGLQGASCSLFFDSVRFPWAEPTSVVSPTPCDYDPRVVGTRCAQEAGRRKRRG